MCKRLFALRGLLSNGLSPLLLVLSCLSELKLPLGSSTLNSSYLLFSFPGESLGLCVRLPNRAFGSGLDLLSA